MDGVKARLALAGMTMGDLVVAPVFCPDRSLYADFNTVRNVKISPRTRKETS